MRAQLGIVVVLVLATSAHAEAPAPAMDRSPVKVTIARADPSRSMPTRAAAARPEVTADQVLSIDELKGTVRAEQEQILAELIAQTPDRDAEEKSDYYFRLGQLLAQQHRHWRLKSAELSREADRTKNGKARAEAGAAAEKAKQYLARAVKTYQAFVDHYAFRNYPKLDTALFHYAYTLQIAGQMAEARKVYARLIKDHPHSKHVPEAHLAFAEHFFDTADLANAEAYYKVVLRFPRSAASWYATYKLGWIHFNAQRYQEALEAFFQVVQGTKSDPALEGLHRASGDDFVRAYAEIGKPDRARAAFRRVDGRRAVDMLQLLAELYLDQGKADRAIAIYQELRTNEPDHPNDCLWRYNLARATAYSAGAPRELEICAADLEPLRDWARASGVTFTCASCAGKPRP